LSGAKSIVFQSQPIRGREKLSLSHREEGKKKGLRIAWGVGVVGNEWENVCAAAGIQVTYYTQYYHSTRR